jgi:hypothetical protein
MEVRSIMKRTTILLLLLCALAAVGLAETPPADLIIGGGGPMPTLLFLDLDDLNAAVTEAGYPQISQILFAMGGGGYGGVLDGVRVGGFGVGGDSLSASASRSVSLELGYGGLIIEKAVHTEDDFHVVLGTMLGLGSLDLRFISDLPNSFQDAVANPFVSTMTKAFYAVQPYIAFESKPCSWMWARLQLGFLWTLADPWTFEEATFSGPPRTLGGLSASFMIRFGGGEPFLFGDPEATLDRMIEKLDSAAPSNGDSDPSQAVETTEPEAP